MTDYSYNRFKRCRSKVKKNRRKEMRPQRTSTPVGCREVGPEYEDASEECIFSVNDFFYQIWKNELDFDVREQYETYEPPVTGYDTQNFNYYIVSHHPVSYSGHVVLFNTFGQHFALYNLPVVYCPCVGYRADGTYGVLPGFWFYYYS